MIPQRFTTEYPQRCAQLLEMLAEPARQRELIGSFSILIAAAAFNIPFARITEDDHPLALKEPGLREEIDRMGKASFLAAPFWKGAVPAFFRCVEILNDPEFAEGWKDSAGAHPMHSKEEKNCYETLNVIRNALAHGNIVYLNENGCEMPKEKVRYLAFLTRPRGKNYRVAIFDEEGFLLFLRCWIAWLQTVPLNPQLVSDDPFEATETN